VFRFLCLVVFSTFFVGCNSTEPTNVAEVTHKAAYDLKSKKAFAVESSVQLPTTNPEDPKSKLQPALYCTQCQKWYPAPPLEELNRNPGSAKCPKNGTPLSAEGPLPEHIIVFPKESE
jgi:uncharacterized protein YbaR (Trm112 family)